MVDSGESYEPSFWDKIGPTLYSIAVLTLNVAFIAAGLAAIYLLFGILSGQLAELVSQPVADQKRVMGVIGGATQIMLLSLAVGSLAVAYTMRGDDSTGYAIVGAAAVIGFGIPFAVQTFGTNIDGKFAARALSAFPSASYVPLIIGGLLIVKDVFSRLASAVREKPLSLENLTYGSEAQTEQKPLRTSLFSRCFEGPFCREFIRTHCPIFESRQACWKVKRGCYCEEDIVATAAAKVQGVTLNMAPDSKFNFSNAPRPGASPAPVAIGSSPIGGNFGGGLAAPAYVPPPPPRRVELTMAQKKERCRNCVIYNEHQREKYKILMPIVMLGGFAVCAVTSPMLRNGIGAVIKWMEVVMSRIQFTGGTGPQFNRPTEAIEWLLVIAFTIMIVSKLLQTLEWACFKIKI